MFSDYERKEKLGRGGNAKVYRCVHVSNKQEFALKILSKGTDEAKARFKDEVDIMKENVSVGGVMPIIEHGTLDNKGEFWYVMPIAQSINIKITTSSIDEIVRGVLELAVTLSELHLKEISHRDIKPDNIYFHDNRFCFGDFGLVSFPDKFSLTDNNRGVGAIFTIAPEMKRYPQFADGKKADVFSLAKTLWILLTGEEKGFDGEYIFTDRKISLRNFQNLKDVHLVELEELLYESTRNAPEDRLDINGFIKKLNEWFTVKNNWQIAQISEWNFIHNLLFIRNKPKSITWNSIDDILNVLNIACHTNQLNHTLFGSEQSGGGLDLHEAKKSLEIDSIELQFDLGSTYILKPKILSLETFKDNPSWNYFRLEIEKTEPVISETAFGYETLIEDYPGNYASAEYAPYGVYDYDKGDKYPDGYRLVHRIYDGSALLIIMKSSPYNSLAGTYDGRHSRVDANRFRVFMELLKISSESGLTDACLEACSSLFGYYDEEPYHAELSKNIQKQSDINEFIESNVQSWDFSNVLQQESTTKIKSISFTFEFCFNKTVSLSKRKKRKHFLGKNGKIIEVPSDILGNVESESPEYQDVFYVSNREIAYEILKCINKQTKAILHENKFYDVGIGSPYFDIVIKGHGRPSHVFTKQEIIDAVRNGDDRINNTLVIDENGYAKLIQDDEHGVFYPVRLEKWIAGNKYVGKYSSLDDTADNYLICLECFLSYLQSRKSQYGDVLYGDKSESELLVEISSILQT